MAKLPGQRAPKMCLEEKISKRMTESKGKREKPISNKFRISNTN